MGELARDFVGEAKERGEKLIKKDAQVYVIDDAELERVRESYPVIWENPDAKPELCFVGCPHLSLSQMEDWAAAIGERLRKNGGVPHTQGFLQGKQYSYPRCSV